MIGATPPSSMCRGARRRQLREFAPLNGRISLSGEWGANSHSRRHLFRVKGLRPSTEE